MTKKLELVDSPYVRPDSVISSWIVKQRDYDQQEYDKDIAAKDARIKELEDKLTFEKVQFETLNQEMGKTEAEILCKRADIAALASQLTASQEEVKQLIQAYDKYIKLLGEEIQSLVGLAVVHGGYVSPRTESGKKCREEIDNIKLTALASKGETNGD